MLHSSDEDDDYEDGGGSIAQDAHHVPNFLKNLPGVTSTDSLGYRIEALRVYLENQLGDGPFVAAYKHLVVSRAVIV